MILTTFYYHLLLWNFALNGPPEAADDPYLHPGVALEATIGIQNFWVFPNQLTFLSMGKVVSCLSEFLRILGITVGCTVFGLSTCLQPGTSIVSPNDDETAGVNEGCRVSSKSPWLARAVEAVMSKKTDET